jgi:hypothetical protein
MMKEVRPACSSAIARAMPPKPQPMIRTGVEIAAVDCAAFASPDAT